MCSAADDPTQHDAMSIDVEALRRKLEVELINGNITQGAYDRLEARLVPAEDEGRLRAAWHAYRDAGLRWFTARGEDARRAADSEWTEARRNLDDALRDAALADTPEPLCEHNIPAVECRIVGCGA